MSPVLPPMSPVLPPMLADVAAPVDKVEGKVEGDKVEGEVEGDKLEGKVEGDKLDVEDEDKDDNPSIMVFLISSFIFFTISSYNDFL